MRLWLIQDKKKWRILKQQLIKMTKETFLENLLVFYFFSSLLLLIFYVPYIIWLLVFANTFLLVMIGVELIKFKSNKKKKNGNY